MKAVSYRICKCVLEWFPGTGSVCSVVQRRHRCPARNCCREVFSMRNCILIYPSHGVIRPDKEPSIAWLKTLLQRPYWRIFWDCYCHKGLFFWHNASAIEYESKNTATNATPIARPAATGATTSPIYIMQWQSAWIPFIFVQTYKIKIILLKGALMDAKKHN